MDVLRNQYPIIGLAMEKVSQYECTPEEYQNWLLNVFDPGNSSVADCIEDCSRAKQEFETKSREFENLKQEAGC